MTGGAERLEWSLPASVVLLLLVVTASSSLVATLRFCSLLMTVLPSGYHATSSSCRISRGLHKKPKPNQTAFPKIQARPRHARHHSWQVAIFFFFFFFSMAGALVA
jgi:hypothetical protein